MVCHAQSTRQSLKLYKAANKYRKMKLILTVIVTVTPIAVGPWGQANFDGQDPDTGKQPNIVFARILNL